MQLTTHRFDDDENMHSPIDVQPLQAQGTKAAAMVSVSPGLVVCVVPDVELASRFGNQSLGGVVHR